MAIASRIISAFFGHSHTYVQGFSFSYHEKKDQPAQTLLEEINNARKNPVAEIENDTRLKGLVCFLQESYQQRQEAESSGFSKESSFAERFSFPFSTTDWALVLDLFEEAKDWNLKIKGSEIAPKRFKIKDEETDASLFSFTYFPKEGSYILHLKNKANRCFLGTGSNCKVTTALEFLKEGKVRLVAERVAVEDVFKMNPELQNSELYLQNGVSYTYFGRRKAEVKASENVEKNTPQEADLYTPKKVIRKHVCFSPIYDGNLDMLFTHMQTSRQDNLKVLLKLMKFCIEVMKDLHGKNLVHKDFDEKNILFRLNDFSDLSNVEFVLADFDYVQEATFADKEREVFYLRKLFKNMLFLCEEGSASKKALIKINEAVTSCDSSIEAIEAAFTAASKTVREF